MYLGQLRAAWRGTTVKLGCRISVVAVIACGWALLCSRKDYSVCRKTLRIAAFRFISDWCHGSEHHGRRQFQMHHIFAFAHTLVNDSGERSSWKINLRVLICSWVRNSVRFYNQEEFCLGSITLTSVPFMLMFEFGGSSRQETPRLFTHYRGRNGVPSFYNQWQ